MSSFVLESKGLTKSYQETGFKIPVFDDINLQLLRGERVAITGTSGSGKSTLLHILAGLDMPDKGLVELNGLPFSEENEIKRGKLRNQYMGFIYQFHHLIAELTALENIMLPLRVRRMNPKLVQEKAEEILKRVGLESRLAHKPSELSGGERQRVAIARALITDPKCILADEPTGNLDHASADQVLELLLELNQEFSTAILIVTHDLSLAAKMDRQLVLIDGQLQT